MTTQKPTNAEAEAVPAATTKVIETTPDDDSQTAPVTPPPASARTEDERNTIDVFGAAAPATVFVTQSRRVFDRVSRRAADIPAGAGTGFIWDTDGHVVTNCHVAIPDCRPSRSGLPKLQVTLFDHKSYSAEVVGIDPAKDIAVLKIDAPKGSLTAIRRPAKGHRLAVGQKTIAIGNPFGLDHTLTTGVVSAIGREVKGIGGLTIRDMIQTDAAINPGNSGGPLLDSSGQLIGMNTMIFSSSGSSAGIGFAVPVNTITRRVPQIIATGRPEKVGIGVSLFPDGTIVVDRKPVAGACIESVVKGSPAEKAGIKPARRTRSGIAVDCVVGVGKTRIRNYDDLFGALENKSAGDKVTMQVLRVPEKVVDVELELVRLD